ncbi:uncharacterized protein LOC116349148 [Contarinia nasturtii]|uniref:uncharacterized protein LOC116349148 n=1 Tax=Contarinia nasturtii TaxID=265458 RepID=UPI0012D42AFA|nr:uncharacterized protein LOC116349148 [Contarinia nasturtii]
MLSKCSMCLFVFVVLFCSVQIISIERNENYEIKLKDHQKLLSRKKRYLTFPEGSSLQLVYDQIIGMVDTTNLHIFGITCSLAWQLPHKTIFGEEHTEQPMHNSKISISTIEKKKFDYNESQSSAGNNYHFDTYYNRSNYYSHKINDNFYDYLNKAKPNYDDWQKFRTNKIKWNYSHDVYPALRMRRHIANHDEKISIIHPEIKQNLKHHRDTRFTLYKSIEKYLNAKGENGEECIKLAICETAQIEHNNNDDENIDPDSFFKELLRSVFSLPPGKFHPIREINPNKYDDALNEVDHKNVIDCRSKYPLCSTSIWSESFIF